jgi:hypothetical protein
MYFDLHIPFPQPLFGNEIKRKKEKGKSKAKSSLRESCWDNLDQADKEGFTKSVALAGQCEIRL